MSEFVYRVANVNDIDQIIKLGNLLIDFDISDTKQSFWSKETLKDCIQNPSSGLVLCAVNDCEMGGFAILQYNNVFKTATIDQLFILPKYRNLGLGRKLYNMIIENVKKQEISEINMNVDFNNRSIIDFFEYNKFEKTMNKVNLKLKL